MKIRQKSKMRSKEDIRRMFKTMKLGSRRERKRFELFTPAQTSTTPKLHLFTKSSSDSGEREKGV